MTADQRKGVVWLAVLVGLVGSALVILWHSGQPHAASPGRRTSYSSVAPEGRLPPRVAPQAAESAIPPTSASGPFTTPSVAPALRAAAGPPAGGIMPPAAYGKGTGFGGGQEPETFAFERDCRANVHRLTTALGMYAMDYDERLPIATRWCDAAEPYVRSDAFYHCPAAAPPYGYAFNSELDGVTAPGGTGPQGVVMLFESSAGRRNAADTGQTLCKPFRHPSGNSIGWLDGHVSLSKGRDRSAFSWRPDGMGAVGR